MGCWVVACINVARSMRWHCVTAVWAWVLRGYILVVPVLGFKLEGMRLWEQVTGLQPLLFRKAHMCWSDRFAGVAGDGKGRG